jgi:hypothetical protein
VRRRRGGLSPPGADRRGARHPDRAAQERGRNLTPFPPSQLPRRDHSKRCSFNQLHLIKTDQITT